MKLSGAQIDWDALRSRLAELTQATQAVGRLSPEAAKRVLEERAQMLAQVPATPLSASEVLEVITFNLFGEQFGIETKFVRGVERPGDLTCVPGTPAFVIGVTNLRGEVLAVMDLGQLLGVAAGVAAERAESPWVLVLGVSRAEFAILADAVLEVVSLQIEDLLEPATSGAGVRREYLRGVTPQALVILDGAALLSDKRLEIDESDEH